MKIPKFAPLIAKLPKSTPFVPPEALERQTGVPVRFRLGANESLFGPSPAAVAALNATASEVWMYPDAEALSLRQALADQHGTDPSRILISAGIDALLDCFSRLFVAPGQAVITTRGGYPTFAYHVRATGGRVVELPYRDAQVPLADMAEAAHAEKARILYLSNPDNPTGSCHDNAAIRELAEAMPVNCALLLDEAYGELAPKGFADAEMSRFPHVIRMRTFSKAYGMAGLRVGYAIAPPEILAGAHRVRNHFGKGRNDIAAAEAALGDVDWLRDTLGRIATARADLAAALSAAGLSPLPSATNFVTAETGRGKAYAEVLLAALLQQGVFVRKPSAAPLDGCIRVTVPPADRIPAFAEALQAALKSLD